MRGRAGGLLGALGLGGPIFALIEQPSYGRLDGRVVVPLLLGCALIVGFVGWDSRVRGPTLPLALLRARNFRVGNLTTLAFMRR